MNKRLDMYLSDLNLSRSQIQTLIKDGLVLVNGEVKKPSYKLREGDVVDVSETYNEKISIVPEDIELDIRYEDDNMLVVNKPSGMLTHPTTTELTGTLVNALLFKYGNNLSSVNGEFRRGILHRLDRNTSGLLMVAKNDETHNFLADQIKNRTVDKRYLAIVKGVIKDDTGVIDEPIGRHPKQPQKMAVVKDGKESITEFSVLERFPNATCVELKLVTGRTHQIRVHMSYINHPVFNDTLYGFGEIRVKTQDQVLQSYSLAFTKPFSDEIIEVQLEHDIKIQKILKYLRGIK